MSVYGVTGATAGNRITTQMISSYTVNMYYNNKESFTLHSEKSQEGNQQPREAFFPDHDQQSREAVLSEREQLTISKNSAKKLSEIWHNANDLSKKAASFDEESEDLEELLKKTHRFVKSYNAVLDSVKEVSSLSLKREAQRLVEDTKANAGSFAKIGISITNSGALEMDEDKFRKTKTDMVKSLLGEIEKYTGKVDEKVTSVKEAVKQELTKSNTYNKSGVYNRNYHYAVECYA